MGNIGIRYKEIRKTIPDHVIIVAAAKTRTVDEIKEAIDAGIEIIGENYVQEAQKAISVLGDQAKWHMIGHLQRNKAKQAVQLFDMIETLDSWRLAEVIDRRCSAIGKTMPVLVEINSGREPNKTGVMPEDVDELIQKLAGLSHIQVQGLMTMGPQFGDPEDARPFFQETKKAFDRISAAGISNIEMRYLSMGMSNSYRVAIEEGSNMIRIGTDLFGPRGG
jgi:pyridoxal phosphate enzyme (YggS family)